MFFRTKDNDTIIEVNRQNTIGTTNWIYNIDKRLPLKLVIPEVIKLQEKKKNSEHKKEGSLDVFSYADSIGKNLAFVPFTEIDFKTQKPKFGIELFVNKKKEIFINGKWLPHISIEKYLEDEATISELGNIYIAIDENSNFDLLINTLIEMQSSKIKRNFTEVFVY